MRTAADYIDERGICTEGMRKFRDGYYYPVERDYFDDGHFLSRLFICGTDILNEENSLLVVPVYQVVWNRGDDPETREPLYIEKDPFRKQDLPYFLNFGFADKTFESVANGWHVREANGHSYNAAAGYSRVEDVEMLLFRGYAPSKSEWWQTCKLINDNPSANSLRDLRLIAIKYKPLPDENQKSVLKLPAEQRRQILSVVYDISTDLFPVVQEQADTVFDNLEYGMGTHKMAYILAGIRCQFSTEEEYRNLFGEWGVNQRELQRFTEEIYRKL